MALKLGDFIKSHIVSIIFSVAALVYVFYTYSLWLNAECVVPVAADLPGHISNFYAYKAQLSQYHFVYPVEFIKDIAGNYWYYYLPFSLMGPAILSLVLTFGKAFFSFYMLFYALSAIAMYFLLRQFGNKLISVLFSSVFLFYILNRPFSVGGSYHFIIGLPFYFFALAFFYKYTNSLSRRDLILFCLSLFMLAITYQFSFFLLMIFIFAYLAVSKKFRLMIFPLLTALSAGYFVLPVILTAQTSGYNLTYTVLGTLSRYVLPQSSPFAWLYLHTTPYSGPLDYNLGLQIFVVAPILFAASCFFIRDKLKSNAGKFLGLLVFISLILFALIFTKFNFVPEERIMALLLYSLFIFSAFLLSELKLNMPALTIVLVFGLLVADRNLGIYYMFFSLIIAFAILLWLKKDPNIIYNINKRDIKFYLSIFILFLLIFPLTGRVETTTLHPRVNHFVLDGIEEFVKPPDVIHYTGTNGLQDGIMACSKSKGLDAWGAGILGTQPIRDAMDIFDNSTQTADFMKFVGVTKILVTVEEIQRRGGVNSVQHLLDRYGEPVVFTAKFKYNKDVSVDIPILIFDTKYSGERRFEIITPAKILVRNPENENEILLPIRYHKWWKPSAGTLTSTGKNGFMYLSNIENQKEILLKLDTIYFKFSAIVSIISAMFLFYAFKKSGRNPDAKPPVNEPQISLANKKQD